MPCQPGAHVFDDRYKCAICSIPARQVIYQLEQRLAEARQLLSEELPYEERTSGYHAEEWTARVRAFLAERNEAAEE